MVSSTLRPHFTPRKDPVPILQEAGWAPGPVWTGGKSRPNGDSFPDRSARSSVAISTELSCPHNVPFRHTLRTEKIEPISGISRKVFLASNFELQISFIVS